MRRRIPVLNGKKFGRMCALIAYIYLTLMVKSTLSQEPPTAPAASADSDELRDSEFLAKFDEMSYTLACKYMSLTKPEDLKLNISRLTTLQDVMKLTFLIKGQNLKSDKLQFGDELTWRRDLVDTLFNLFTNACPDRFVKKEYLNIQRELVMVYLNSIEMPGTNESKLWDTLKKELKSCESAPTPYDFTSEGLMSTNVIVRQAAADEGEGEGAGETLTVSAQPMVESATVVYNLDPIIDMLWIVFSHAWAICLPKITAKELWGPRFKELFYKEFFAPLERRWTNPGPISRHMGLMIGDFDIVRMENNILGCLQAGYITNNMEKVQLMRPVKLASLDKGVSSFQNQWHTETAVGPIQDDDWWFDFWFKK